MKMLKIVIDTVPLFQYFTLPGDENFELVKGGKNRAVTCSNALQFVKVLFYLWLTAQALCRTFALLL